MMWFQIEYTIDLSYLYFTVTFIYLHVSENDLIITMIQWIKDKNVDILYQVLEVLVQTYCIHWNVTSLIKISKYLEIHIKTRMLLIHSKSSSKYKDLRLHPPIARHSFSLVYHTSIDNTGRHGQRGYRLKVILLMHINAVEIVEMSSWTIIIKQVVD